ncbi:MAG: ester cyclase [Bacteroidales bacterium]|nr:ester cyclase [Bacteroidales bacterium]
MIASVLFFVLIGCQNNQTKEELEKYRAQVVLEEQNEILVKQVFDRLNQQDETVYKELCAANYSWYFPANNTEKLTREEEAGFVKLVWSAFPDIQWKIEGMIASGNTVMVRFTNTGTHEGEYQGLPPTGNKWESGGVWIARIQGGKLVEVREEADVLGWMQQLGMELKMKE